ncbi:hypothetical protein M413DRAFT_422925 [Hebeloma cylindrosporum]|uniref:DUF4238 domain-containing protein n=1 Tax=Hebeloma cylindrosporum TaxID=76867 RepID=A0A0C3CTH9_HEBCY|nr:hypothetical protein M413DRAFT_422925 [Hebeloma cylindrosporum h7]
MPAPPGNALPRDQYQHYIPRFILRYFQDAQVQPRNRKERQKNFHKMRRTGVDTDTILMYDVTTQTLESRPIAKVYGDVNLYRDDRNADNVDHLEQGLSRLENDAARTIRNIHYAIESHQQKIVMKRKELEAIRKFTYLMHYRRTCFVSSYFDENDPENMPLRDWAKNFRRKHNLYKEDDIWLFGLKYMLEVPHHKIVATGEAIQNKYGGPQGMVTMLMTRVDPDIEDYHAVDYTAMSNALFLGIWEAAEGEEFVLGANSFGLWEGVVETIPGLHRLFVVSPRVALVLRQNKMGPEVIDQIRAHVDVTSDLVDVPMSRATSTYANHEDPPWSDNPSDLEAAAQALWKYRQTPEAQEDIFTFTRTKLTRKQTHDLNHVILTHLSDNGMTFSSPVAARKTIQQHLQSDIPYARESKYWFRNLLGLLSENTTATGPNPSTSSTLPSAVDIVLGSIASGAIEFRSNYDRAYRVYHLATDDVTKYNQSSSEIHQMTARAIHAMKEHLPPLPIIHRHMYFPFLCRDIVKELPKEESELFFALVGYRVDLFKVGPMSDDILGRIKYEAAIIGFAHWLAENRAKVLSDLLSFWVKVVL